MIFKRLLLVSSAGFLLGAAGARAQDDDPTIRAIPDPEADLPDAVTAEIPFPDEASDEGAARSEAGRSGERRDAGLDTARNAASNGLDTAGGAAADGLATAQANAAEAASDALANAAEARANAAEAQDNAAEAAAEALANAAEARAAAAEAASEALAAAAAAAEANREELARSHPPDRLPDGAPDLPEQVPEDLPGVPGQTPPEGVDLPTPPAGGAGS